MEYRGIVTNITKNEVTLQVTKDMDLDKIKRMMVGGKVKATVEFIEKDSITHLQRNHFFALMGDYSAYTGVPRKHAESYFLYHYMLEVDLPMYPSLANNEMKKQVASDLLEYVITYFIQNDIPFNKQQFYVTMDISKMLFALTMKRLCWVCGEPHAEIHHATNLVGMGNDRKEHDHWNSTFMALCWKHHTEAHWMGLYDFCEKHHVKPVRLDAEQLKELNII